MKIITQDGWCDWRDTEKEQGVNGNGEMSSYAYYENDNVCKQVARNISCKFVINNNSF